MSCHKPLKGFVVGKTNKGKDDYMVCSYNVNHLELCNGKWIKCENTFISPQAERVVSSFIEIPCNQCIGCRIDYSKSWANRCMLEAKQHKSNYFITLTYDEEHVPYNGFNVNTGESSIDVSNQSMSLRKKDLQDFFKRLRKNTGQKVRYYACGEYGDNTYRPHYHLIVFGLELNDLVPNGSNETGDIYFNSKTIEKCWKNGFSGVANCTYDTCAYTARYVMKKLKGQESQFYEAYNIEPEFVLMSRRPGIARDYYDQNFKSIYEFNNIVIGDSKGSHKFKPPRYFNKLYELDYPEDYKRINEINKKVAEDFKHFKLSKTSKSYLEMLEDEELVLKDKISRKQKERRL